MEVRRRVCYGDWFVVVGRRESAMPVRIDQFEEVDASVFDEYPQPMAPGKKIDPQWEELLTKLDQGSVVRLPPGDGSDLRGLRLALGRRAVGRGFKVETRTDGQTLVVRKSDQPMTPKAQPAPASTTAPKRGRARKPQDGAAVAEGTYAQNEAV